MVKILKYLDVKLIHFFECDTREELIGGLVDLLAEQEKLQDKKSFQKALLDREKIISTGIGMGVAIPHAKLPDYDNFFIAIGIQPNGIEWQSLDGLPVHLVFMIGGPDNMQTRYLQVLSQLTSVIKDEELRKKIIKASSPEDVISIFEEA